NSVSLSSSEADVRLSNWPSSPGSISVVGKKVGSNQVLHLLNFSNAQTNEWKDNKAIQPKPTRFKNIELQFSSKEKVKTIWSSSPDELGSASRSLNFHQANDKVSFVLPLLEYWTMVVIEY